METTENITGIPPFQRAEVLRANMDFILADGVHTEEEAMGVLVREFQELGDTTIPDRKTLRQYLQLLELPDEAQELLRKELLHPSAAVEMVEAAQNMAKKTRIPPRTLMAEMVHSLPSTVDDEQAAVKQAIEAVQQDHLPRRVRAVHTPGKIRQGIRRLINRLKSPEALQLASAVIPSVVQLAMQQKRNPQPVISLPEGVRIVSVDEVKHLIDANDKRIKGVLVAA